LKGSSLLCLFFHVQVKIITLIILVYECSELASARNLTTLV